jgi:putative lipoic acid-binding regulatory protein
MTESESLELLLATHHFPGPYMFKVIGRDTAGFQARVLLAIREALKIGQDPPFRTQPSSGGKHVSITLEPHVFSAEEVIIVYRHLRQTEGVAMVM